MQDAGMVLRCPKCRTIMESREVTGHYGTKLVIFHCPDCSGIWVDRDVAFAVSRDSAVAVESDVDLGEIPTEPREAPVFCPRCETYLAEQTGSGLPKGLRLDYCTGCHGFWFDKGELMIYKSYLEKKRQQSATQLKEREEAQRKKRKRQEKWDRKFELQRSSTASDNFLLVGARLLSVLLRLVR